MLRYHHLTIISLLFLCGGNATAAEVSVVGVMGKRVLLVIDGGKPHWLAVGETSGDVKLVAINGDTATVETDGKRETVTMGESSQLASGGLAAGDQQVTLMADQGGHFFATGTINGIGVRLLVDTGASFISMNSSDAKRLGIDYLSGQRTAISTANGVAPAYKVRLDEVRVGDITLNNVEGMVHVGDALPVMLLGMSFLNRMEMQRDGEKMVLIKRY